MVVLSGACGSATIKTDAGADAPAGHDGNQVDTSAADMNRQDLAPDIGGTDAPDAPDVADGGQDAPQDVAPQIATWDSPTAIWDQSLWN